MVGKQQSGDIEPGSMLPTLVRSSRVSALSRNRMKRGIFVGAHVNFVAKEQLKTDEYEI